MSDSDTGRMPGDIHMKVSRRLPAASSGRYRMKYTHNKLKHILTALFSTLCLAFICILLMGGTGAHAAASGGAISWNNAVTGINNIQVEYVTEDVVVESASRIYYAVMKKNTATGVKPAELIPATNGGSGNSYLIDISTISASKEAYVGVTTATAAGSDGLVPVTTITLAPTVRKINFNLNWGVEGAAAHDYGIFQNVDVTGADAVQVSYVSTVSQSGQRPITDLDIQWRKGSNAPWRNITELTTMQWESMKNAGSVIYLRTGATNGAVVAAGTNDGYETGHRYSKEIKVKMNVTKATKVKLDVSKLTLSIKNGIQFRPTVSGAAVSVSGGAISGDYWFTVLPYNASSTKNDSALRSMSNTTLFNPFTENTQVKLTYMSIDDIRQLSGLPDSQSIVLEVRLAATTKKAASRVSIVDIPVQGGAPTATVAATDKGWTVSSITAATDITAPANFEFTLVKKEDVSPVNKLDPAQMKWSSIKSGTVLKNTLKGTYTNAEKARRTVLITDADSVLLIRRKGVAPSSKAAAVLASRFIAIEIPHPAVTPTPTPTPTATPAPTSTPSPVPTTAP